MKVKKILFAIPKVKSMYGDKLSRPLYPHVGIAYLTAVLKKAGYQVAIFDQGVEPEIKNLYQLIDQFKPDLIGTTGYSYASTFLKNLISDIKIHSSVPIIVGGPHVSAVTKNILTETKADFAMVSESEVSFPLFLNQFFQKKPYYSKVPSLIWKHNNAIVQNPQSNYLVDLDKLPLPDYYAFQFDLYPCYLENKIPLTTSRGCPYGCNYCSVKLSMGQCFRPRSAQNVFSEIKYWYSRGFNKIDINDDCFTLDINRAEKICDLIIKNKLQLQIQLYNGIRVDRVNLNLLRKLKQAGCIFIAYGCESGSQKIIDHMGKNIKLKQVKQAVRWTNQVGIKNAVNFIIGHPDETYNDALKSLRFANSLPTNFVNFYNLVPYPGTKAYDWVVKNGRFLLPPENFLESSSYRDNNPIFDTPEFTEKQRRQIMKIGFNLYEKKLFRFRLGNNFGYLIYLVTRIKLFSELAHWILTNSKFVSALTVRLISKSKK
jgi:anaerobic magnesium-protoporphyrin IX monomethyl ester cyclase